MILVLRPEPGASETVRRLRDSGLEAISVPLFVVQPLEWELPDPARFDALLLTSANAVRHGGEQLVKLRGLPVHAVGEATAKAAREAGFDISSSGDAGVDRLLGSIDQELRLLHLCGTDRREPAGARQQITAVAVYQATPVGQPDLGSARGSVALIHSPRAGTRFGELIGASDRPTIAVAAISDAAAQAVGDGWKACEAAAQPNEEALLALAARLCQKSAA
jgi:uroporphyrinogen-III synthase